MDNVTKEDGEKMQTKYIPDTEFALFIHTQKDNARLVNLDGHARWLVKEDGVEFIARPKGARNHDEQENA